MQYPPFPINAQAVYDYRGHGECMACAIVKRYDIRQRMVFRKLRLQLGEPNFRELLVEAIEVMAHSGNIRNPAGWLYDYLRQEVNAANVSR